MSETEKKIKIEAEPAGTPHSYKFTVERSVYPLGAITFKNKEDAEQAPLSKALFALDGVAKLSIVGSVVTVTADAEHRWPPLAYEVGKTIRAVLASDEVLWPEGARGSVSKEDEAKKSEIRALIDAEINPAVAGHGGMIDMVDYDDRIVYLRMMGGCQGCGAADVTLRMGVERMLKERFGDAIAQVVDVTDHASGTNPYITAGK